MDGREHCFLVVTRTILVRRLVACVRCPVPGPPRSESVVWLVPLPAAGFPVGRCIGFAVVMAQVRRPVPFRTRKLRPGCGDGTALERVWESSAPPHSLVWGFPSSVWLRKPPFFLLFRPVGLFSFSRPAWSGFQLSKELLLFRTDASCSERLLARHMIRFAEYGLWNGIGKDGSGVPEHRSAACTMRTSHSATCAPTYSSHHRASVYRGL